MKKIILYIAVFINIISSSQAQINFSIENSNDTTWLRINGTGTLTEASITSRLSTPGTIYNRIVIVDNSQITISEPIDLSGYNDLTFRVVGDNSLVNFDGSGGSSGELILDETGKFRISPSNSDGLTGDNGGNVRITFIGAGSGNGANADITFNGNELEAFALGGGLIPDEVLPITLAYFNGIQKDSHIELNWATATEKNNSHIEILRSKDLSSWNVIGEVEGNGTTNGLMHYSFIDENPTSGDNYYKLKQYDYNGDTEEHKTIAVEFLTEIGVYPNPSNGEITVHLKELDRNQGFNYEITNVSHSVVSSGLIEGEETNLNLDLEKGIYILKVYNNATTYHVKLLIEN